MYEVQFISISGNLKSKKFANLQHVKDFVHRYDVDKVIVSGEDFQEEYTDQEFLENYDVANSL